MRLANIRKCEINYSTDRTRTTSHRTVALLGFNPAITDQDNNLIPLDTATSVSEMHIPPNVSLEFELTVLSGSLEFVFIDDKGKILRVPVPNFAEISFINNLFNIWGTTFNKMWAVLDHVQVKAINGNAIIQISNIWEDVDAGEIFTYKLANSNCVKFTEPVGLGLTLADFGIRIDHDWSICFYLKDCRTYNDKNILLNAGAFFIYSLPHSNGGQLVVGTSENSTGTWFCETPRFVEGLFVLVYSAQEKRLRIYYNNQLSLDETKENLSSWDASQEVFLAKTRFQVFWDTPSDFNMAGFGIFQRVLSEAEIQEYYRHVIPDNSKVFYPMAEGYENLLYDVSTFPVFLSNSNCATFDGLSTYINTQKTIAQLKTDYNNAFSITFNFRLSNLSPGRYFYGYQHSSPTFKGQFFEVNLNGILTFKFTEDYSVSPKIQTAYSSANGVISTNTFYNLVLTYDGQMGTDSLKIYLNNSEVTMTRSTVGVYVSASVSTNDRFPSIGDLNNNNSSFYPCNDILYNFTIYSKVLSTAEIAELANGGFISDSVTLAYPLAEGAGVIAYDVSGNDNHGTISNANLSTFWGARQDKFHYNLLKGHSKLMYFDGSDDYIDLGSGSGVGANFIISAEFFNNTDMSAEQAILNFRPVSGDANEIRLFVKNSKLVAVVIDQAGNGAGYKTYYGATTIQANTFYKVVLVFDGTNLDLYLQEGKDGTLTKDTPYTKIVDDSITMSDTTRNRRIGCATYDSKLWKGAITKLQIASYSTANLNEIISGDFSSPDFYYTGYGNTDADWVDQSGNGNDGTVNGLPINIRIPALSDASADAAGGTLKNPAWDGINNNDSETILSNDFSSFHSEQVMLSSNTIENSSIEWTKQDELHYNLMNGFRKEDNVKVPAIPGQNKSANGKPLTNLAWDGYNLNGAETVWTETAL